MRSSGATPVLEASQLYRFYHVGDDETLALRGVSLRVRSGEVVAITGPSGSGKSTLLACLAGLDEPNGGWVIVNGQRLSRRSEPERAKIRAANIGMLFQSGNLVEHLTVIENVLLAQRLVGKPNRTKSEETLGELGLSERMNSRPSRLSGGESARAGLAVALANRPAVLLADEPTGELDGTTQQRVLQILRDVANSGTAVVVVTHNATVAGSADRVVRLNDGQVVQ